MILQISPFVSREEVGAGVRREGGRVGSGGVKGERSRAGMYDTGCTKKGAGDNERDGKGAGARGGA